MVCFQLDANNTITNALVVADESAMGELGLVPAVPGAWIGDTYCLTLPEPDELTQTQLAVAELAQVVEESNTANQLAIAELAEAMMGGEA